MQLKLDTFFALLHKDHHNYCFKGVCNKKILR